MGWYQLVTRTSKWKNMIYIAAIQIVAKLQMVMLYKTVLSLKTLSSFDKYESQITRKYFDSPQILHLHLLHLHLLSFATLQ